MQLQIVFHKINKKLFWKKVKKTKTCWVWIGDTNESGYGRYCQIRAHRVSWVLHYGKIPKGKLVLHHCDNPPCIRPSHLWLGTHKDNVIDMDKKGRRISVPQLGSKHGMSKLTEKKVLKIRDLYQSYVNAIKNTRKKRNEINKLFGVCRGTIEQIIQRRIWRHI
jgi:hypothetical protein